MNISIMRHGAVNGPAALYGHTDIACTAAGHMDMEQQLTGIPSVTEIISSPKKRCLAFATQLAERRGVPLLIVDDLRELSFGAWDGISFDDLQDVWSEVEFYLNHPEHATPPEGENLRAFYHRVSHTWQQLNNRFTTSAPLLICHGAVIRMILANVMEMHFGAVQWFSRLDIRYASVTQISRQSWDNQHFFRIQAIGSKQ